MRRFVIVGRTAIASGRFLPKDLPGTSGRLDVLLRCIRAALLVSHGVRRDTQVYLVLLGGAEAPRTVRIDGATAKFLRPDERSLATLIAKSLGAPERGAAGFDEVRPGVAIARGGLECVLEDIGGSSRYVLEEGAADLREVPLNAESCTFFVGDHLGLDSAALEGLAGASRVGVGPVSLHAEDAIVTVINELDRRDAAGRRSVATGNRPPGSE